MEASPGQADQLHILQQIPHTCIHKWREGITGRYVPPPPKKIVGGGGGLWGILPKEGQPGDTHSNTDVGRRVPEISQINTANKSVESCRVSNRKKKTNNMKTAIMPKSLLLNLFIAGSSKCSTKPASILLTKLLTHIKQGLQKYCKTAYPWIGINQMWILKNSNELLEHLNLAYNHLTSIKSFDFSKLYHVYTIITHQKLNNRQTSIIRMSETNRLTSHSTIFQLFMWRNIDVQVDGRSSTYSRAPNAIDIS